METKEGHVRTTYKSEAMATTPGGSATPTKSTTMQGRSLSLDYAWTRSFDLRRQHVVGWRDYKDTTVHIYLEGYFHVEACGYTVKGSRCSLLGKRLQLHDDNSISISLESSYWDNMLRPYHLDGDNAKTVATTCLEQQPLQERERSWTHNNTKCLELR